MNKSPDSTNFPNEVTATVVRVSRHPMISAMKWDSHNGVAVEGSLGPKGHRFKSHLSPSLTYPICQGLVLCLI